MKKAFTLIEILVVVTIIGLLTAGAAVSYGQFTKQSRDARRKADLEQIRAALEMYRSNSTISSYPEITANLVPTYIKSLPKNPKPEGDYPYTKLPNTCNNSLANPCTNYSLSVDLESSRGVYSVGPYGSSVDAPTPIPL